MIFKNIKYWFCALWQLFRSFAKILFLIFSTFRTFSVSFRNIYIQFWHTILENVLEEFLEQFSMLFNKSFLFHCLCHHRTTYECLLEAKGEVESFHVLFLGNLVHEEQIFYWMLWPCCPFVAIFASIFVHTGLSFRIQRRGVRRIHKKHLCGSGWNKASS